MGSESLRVFESSECWMLRLKKEAVNKLGGDLKRWTRFSSEGVKKLYPIPLYELAASLVPAATRTTSRFGRLPVCKSRSYSSVHTGLFHSSCVEGDIMQVPDSAYHAQQLLSTSYGS